MGYCEDAKALIGRVSLFMGVETYNWTIAQFQQAAHQARSWGINTLIIKVADGGNRWYGGNWKPIRDAMLGAGIGCLFYTYSYGSKFGAFQTELDILKTLLHDYGAAVADLEVEWNGRPDLAQTMATQLGGAPGQLFVTTWANPSGQNWMEVAKALGPAVKCWLPQAYDDYLYGVMQRDYSALGCYAPVFDLTNEYGANDIVSFAEQALAGGAVSLWEYAPALSAASLVTQIVKIMQQGKVVPPVVTPTQPQQPLTFTDNDRHLWTLLQPIVINQQAAIEQSWLRALVDGRYFGPPLENEHTVVVGGKTYVEQAFSAALAVYEVGTGVLTWHTASGPVQV
jgi:hypothetical protein